VKNDFQRNNTKCVHAGNVYDENGLGVNTPIFASTAHLYPNPKDEIRYPRSYNIPTQTAVADKIRLLEGGEAGLVLSSGMAAITTVLFGLLKKGDQAVFQGGLYGGTQRFIDSELERYGIEKCYVKSNSVPDYTDAIKDNTKVIYVESPTNPLLGIIDLRGITKLGKDHGILTVIDNTFATPINQNPLKLGIDIVIHSGTKYLNGHSDVCCGAVVTSNELMKDIIDIAYSHGGVLDAHACYLLERGMKTLGLRVAQQNNNAQRIAEFLNKNPKVKRVYYPGLPDHPRYDIAKNQMHGGFGGMLSFELACEPAAAKEFAQNLDVITSAVSLGGVESILCFPSETSHSEITAEQRHAQGISDSLLRLSVGIEDVEDLINDLENGLEKI
jgi:cystathionine beta-lyase